MKLLTWNIRHGGRGREEKIAAALGAHDADVIVLTEYRTRAGMAICDQLADWRFVLTTEPTEGVNGICLLSRVPFELVPSSGVPRPERWLEVSFGDLGFSLVAVHIPGSTDRAGLMGKRAFWDFVLGWAEANSDRPVAILGDFNTGLHHVDETGRTFQCSSHFAQLGRLLTDAWRNCHGDAQEWSWLSASRNGFRLDHAFISLSLAPRLINCRYSHLEREQGISDHSMLELELGTAPTPSSLRLEPPNSPSRQ